MKCLLGAAATCLEAAHELCFERDTMMWKEKFPLCTGGTFIDLCREIKNTCHHLDGPFKIMHGADDGVVFPSGSQAMMERSPYVAAELAAGRPSPVMMLPEGYRHGLLGDWCSVAVVDDMILWCKACFAAAAGEEV